MVSEVAGVTEVDTSDAQLLDEEAGPSNKRLQKTRKL
jgi:hypothetical protein